MAYRTRRAFRAQYDLLLAASRVDEASARLEAPVGPLRRRFQWRLTRDMEERRVALDRQLHEFRSETLHLLAPADYLPGLSRIVLAQANLAARAPAVRRPTATARLASLALGRPAARACLAAWAATAGELLARGLANRPSLVIAEVTALVLSPGAIFSSPREGVGRE